MATPHKRRILLVEDQPQVYRTLMRRLSAAGYDVTLAAGYTDARRLLDEATFHLAVIDKRLDAADESNEDGLRLLEDVEAMGLRGVMPCIMMTAYGTLPDALRSLQELGASRMILKEPGYVRRLLNVVRDIFDKEIKIGFDIEYVGNSRQYIEQGAHDIHAAESGWPASEKLIPEIDDLLGRLFNGAKRLWLKRLVKGLSGSIVLEVHPAWGGGLGQPLIVKVGRRDKTKTEESNYREYVERYLPANRTTQLRVHYSRHLGALLYTLAGSEASDTVEFETFYQTQPASEIVAALQRLFRVTCRLWYHARSAPGLESLRDLYLDAFNLTHQPKRLQDEIASFRPYFQPRSPIVPFDPPGITLPNPLHWLADDDASVLPVCRSTTHGDLNARNILMNDSGECWLIDFYRTQPSHLLRDFVVLETDVKFRLMEALAPQTFLEFEQSLLALENPENGFAPDARLPDGAQKAAQVIAGLRAEAWGLLLDSIRDTRQVQREYLISLLMTTLNVLRLRHFRQDPELQPRRELALMSAGLICRHLQIRS